MKQKHDCFRKSKSINMEFNNKKTNSAFSFLAAKIAVCRIDCARQPYGLVGWKKIILATLRYFFSAKPCRNPRQTDNTSNKK